MGRMPSVLTGANLANRDLIYLGVFRWTAISASIGFGQFRTFDPARRQHDLYRREQRRLRPHQGASFSATADRGSKSKKGVMNTDNAIDLTAIALQLGASYVGAQLLRRQDATGAVDRGARSSTRGAGLHRRDQPLRRLQQPRRLGPRALTMFREHNDAVNRLDVITGREPITVDYAPGTVRGGRTT